jgi:putative nucleotidyltransferase with HDIG domain
VISGEDRVPPGPADAAPDDLRVLLVDAQARVLRFMAFAFASNDCLVSTASNAESALDFLAREPCDLVVTDLDLPGTSGMDLLTAVKMQHPTLPVVLTTGSQSLDSAVLALRQQAYDYLKKPFTVEEVQQLVGRIRADRQRARELAPAAPPAEEAERRRSALNELSLIGDLALQGLDTGAFVEKALDHVVLGLTSGGVAVLLLRDEDGHVTVSRNGDRTLTDWLFAVLEPAVESLFGAPEHLPVELGSPAQGFAALAVVIPDGVRPLGVLAVARGEDATFSADERELLLAYGRLLAVSLQKIVLNEQLEANLIDTISSFVVALEAKDTYLKGHSARVSLYVGEIAKVMGLSTAQTALARRAGVLHDLGKLVLRESIYQKPGALTYEGSALMRGHPLVGADILKPLRFLAHEAEAICRHHERYDGAGYPGGLKGEQIPLAARLIAVADAFDAMTSSRPYRAAMPIEGALEQIRKNAGTQFDPVVTQAFGRIPAARLTEIARFYDTGPRSADTPAARTPSALLAASRLLLEVKGWSDGHAVEGRKPRQPKPPNVIGIARAASRRHGPREG